MQNTWRASILLQVSLKAPTGSSTQIVRHPRPRSVTTIVCSSELPRSLFRDDVSNCHRRPAYRRPAWPHHNIVSPLNHSCLSLNSPLSCSPVNKIRDFRIFVASLSPMPWPTILARTLKPCFVHDTVIACDIRPPSPGLDVVHRQEQRLVGSHPYPLNLRSTVPTATVVAVAGAQ